MSHLSLKVKTKLILNSKSLIFGNELSAKEVITLAKGLNTDN